MYLWFLWLPVNAACRELASPVASEAGPRCIYFSIGLDYMLMSADASGLNTTL